MRLFVAVEIVDEARQVAADVADRLRNELGSIVAARWANPANMHLTVRFIGHVVDERVPAVLDALRPSVRVAPFDVVLGGCGVFPSSGMPRVIWIGLREGLHSLAAMHEEFNRRLEPLGFDPEDRPYSAHLTLARLTGGRSSVRRTIAGKIVTPVRWRVTKAAVFHSLLSPKGSRYQRLFHVLCEEP